MNVIELPIDKITPYEGNPRRNQEAIAPVAASLKEFGWRQPIVVDAEMVIIVGHTRLLAAIDLGLTKVPVIVAKDMTPEQAKAYRLADNRTGENAEWNPDLLAVELNDISEFSDLGITGFNEAELAFYLDEGDTNNTGPVWDGMPACNTEDKTAFKSCVFHFKDQEALESFESLINTKLTNRYFWWPEIEIDSTAPLEIRSES